MVTPLTLLELGKFADIAYQQTGIRLTANKLELMNNRLGRRLRDLNLDSYRKYLRYLRENLAVELSNFIQVITTNETFFFRYPFHYYLLSKEIFPTLKGSEVTIWSAACSSGEEAYSLAIVCQERLPNFFNRQVNIYASDIDLSVLKKAHDGVYNSYALRNVRKEHLTKYFRPVDREYYRIDPSLRERVALGQHNLKKLFPRGKVDILFCRNVLIYFDDESKNLVLENLVRSLKPGGYLFLGESEIVPDMPELTRMKSSVAKKAG
ncbi:MAG: protein-glutamate O-methyltransferase CheR [Proteobacteria bacterium]|nr:protein-glutamate O-methyltransferase CheR [Pseudomonadota bacterium]